MKSYELNRYLRLLVGICCLASTAYGRTLEVVLPNEAALAGCTLRVYAVSPDQDFPKIVAERRLQSEASISVPVESGTYAVEVEGKTEHCLIALKKSRVRVVESARIELKALKGSVQAIIGDNEVPISQVAVRRIGAGETRWIRKSQSSSASSGSLELLLTPGEHCMMSCVAETRSVLLAVWRNVTLKSDRNITFSDNEAKYQITVEPFDNTPQLQKVAVDFGFPDATFTLNHALEGQRFKTNRDRAIVSYRFETVEGQRLTFFGRPQLFKAESRIRIGGKLHANVVGAWLSREEAGKTLNLLARRLYLQDGNGRWVDTRASSLDLKCQVHFQGRTFPYDDGSDIAIDGKTFDPKQVQATVSYHYGQESIREVVPATGWFVKSSPHFKIDVVRGLEIQAEVYLQMAEILRKIDQKLSKRPGPTSWQIKWRGNHDNAASVVGRKDGGQTDLWMSLPFWSLEKFIDPFVEPVFDNDDPYVAHELLHGFGFQHGEEMSRLELQAEETFRYIRWRAVDTGVWPVWPSSLRDESN